MDPYSSRSAVMSVLTTEREEYGTFLLPGMTHVPAWSGRVRAIGCMSRSRRAKHEVSIEGLPAVCFRCSSYGISNQLPFGVPSKSS